MTDNSRTRQKASPKSAPKSKSQPIDLYRCLSIAEEEDLNQHYSMGLYKRKFIVDKVIQPALLPKHPLIVELGVCHGSTAVMLAYIAECLGGHYVGIDTWLLEGSMLSVMEKLVARGLWKDTSTLIEQNTHKAKLPEWVKPEIDLLIVDAGHDEANVGPDCEIWIPKVAPGGIVVFDDCPEQVNADDPHWAVKHYAEQHTQGWEVLGYWNPSGVLIKRKPKV